MTTQQADEAELDKLKRRGMVTHSLTLHRDSTSATDVETMIGHLRSAGMPDHATLSVNGSQGHTRMLATWRTDPEGGRA